MHPVIATHLGAKGGAMNPAAEGTGYATPDAPPIALPNVTFGNSDRTPHAVAGMAVLALGGVILLKLSGFRFVVGGAAGILR